VTKCCCERRCCRALWARWYQHWADVPAAAKHAQEGKGCQRVAGWGGVLCVVTCECWEGYGTAESSCFTSSHLSCDFEVLVHKIDMCRTHTCREKSGTIQGVNCTPRPPTLALLGVFPVKGKHGAACWIAVTPWALCFTTSVVQ
jgi:hypothetical protein